MEMEYFPECFNQHWVQASKKGKNLWNNLCFFNEYLCFRNGKPKRSISTILMILNDLLGASESDKQNRNRTNIILDSSQSKVN
jgi:hypothetical protein